MSTELKILATDDFDIISRRLELYAKSTTARDLIKLELEQEHQKALTARKSQIDKQEKRIEFAENVILMIAAEHPEWFTDKKSLVTPFGSINSRATTSHKVSDEQHTIRLIKAAATRTDDEIQRARLLGLIRVKEELNLEAVECLSEKELNALRIVRVKGASLSITIAKAGAKKGGAKKAKVAPEATVKEAA
ncbi:MAG TPA: host-nuclease inhibitor Gam family protein [Chthoniobacter sp.]|nr:host-nuclease inhibitor Gam family protein [Chthoniobacter sp.]